MISPVITAAVLRDVRRRGSDFADLYVEHWQWRALRPVDGEVVVAPRAIDHGVALGLFFGADVVDADRNDVADETVRDLADAPVRPRGGAGTVGETGGGALGLRRRAACLSPPRHSTSGGEHGASDGRESQVPAHGSPLPFDRSRAAPRRGRRTYGPFTVRAPG